MTERPEIAKRFANETAEHVMTVAHDDGLYRHLRFRHTGKNYSGYYWFDLITVPGALIFQGDGDGFIFQRVEDIFTFFRGRVGEINPHYWQEKVVSGRDRIRTYDERVFRAKVLEEFTEACQWGVPRGTGRALREQLLDDDYSELHYEVGARDALDRFEHDGFRFEDTSEWDFRDYDWWFLWACHAMVWGIAYYDTGERPTVPIPAAKAPHEKVRPQQRVIAESEPPRRRSGYRPVVDVQLPAVVS
jgi:hypothetical protein